MFKRVTFVSFICSITYLLHYLFRFELYCCLMIFTVSLYFAALFYFSSHYFLLYPITHGIIDVLAILHPLRVLNLLSLDLQSFL
jgi:hypothetical protein